MLGVLASIWFVNLSAKPLAALLAYGETAELAVRGILAREDEVGDMARLFLHVARRGTRSGTPPAAEGASARD